MPGLLPVHNITLTHDIILFFLLELLHQKVLNAGPRSKFVKMSFSPEINLHVYNSSSGGKGSEVGGDLVSLR